MFHHVSNTYHKSSLISYSYVLPLFLPFAAVLVLHFSFFLLSCTAQKCPFCSQELLNFFDIFCDASKYHVTKPTVSSSGELLKGFETVIGDTNSYKIRGLLINREYVLDDVFFNLLFTLLNNWMKNNLLNKQINIQFQRNNFFISYFILRYIYP